MCWRIRRVHWLQRLILDLPEVLLPVLLAVASFLPWQVWKNAKQKRKKTSLKVVVSLNTFPKLIRASSASLCILAACPQIHWCLPRRGRGMGWWRRWWQLHKPYIARQFQISGKNRQNGVQHGVSMWFVLTKYEWLWSYGWTHLSSQPVLLPRLFSQRPLKIAKANDTATKCRNDIEPPNQWNKKDSLTNSKFLF